MISTSNGFNWNWERMINYCPMFIILWLMFSTALESVGGCSVYPTNVVVTVGERVLLTCSTNERSYIFSWYIQIDVKRTFTVYAQFRTVAEGYFVTHPAYNETTLHINETILSQAGLYVCTCVDASRSTATVVVLDSEPTFTTDDSLTDGEPVTFSCSMSFNASSDVSCQLKIEDASGSTIRPTNENDATVNGGLIFCNLNHTIVANASYGQWFTCNVTLSSNSGGIIYSRVLNAAVDWQPIGSTAEYLSSEETSQTHTIVLSITIFAVVSIIACVAFFRLHSRKRVPTHQRSMGQPTEQPSNCPQRPPANRYDKNKIGDEIPTARETSRLDDGYYLDGGAIYTEVIR